MRFYRNAIILITVTAILLGAYFFVQWQKGKEVDPVDEKIEIINIDDEIDIQEVVIENRGEKLVFKKDGLEWTMNPEEEFRFDKFKIDGIVANFKQLSAKRIIEEDSIDLNKYGFDKPAVVTVTTSEGLEIGVEVGNETPTKEAYYLKKKGENTVYTVETYLGEYFSYSKTDLKDRYVFDALPTDVTHLSVIRDGKIVFNAGLTDEYQWMLKEPIEADIDYSKLDGAINDAIRAQIASFIEENPLDLSIYGLDQPKYVMEIATANNREIVEFGIEKEKNWEIYARFKDGKDVFTLHPSNFEFLEMSTMEIALPIVYIANINDVSEMNVTIDGRTISSQIDTSLDNTDPDKEKYIIDGKDVKAKGDEGVSAFKDFYQAVIGVTFSSVETDAVLSEADPEIVFDFKLKVAPGSTRIEFVSKDDENYYVLKDGKYTGKVVDKSQFDKQDSITKTYQKLMELLSN
jgi:hypothetical protein